MNTVTTALPAMPALEDYLAQLKPIPLNGVMPDTDSLARWATEMFPWMHVGDTLADQAVLALRKHGIGLANPASALQSLADQGDKACQALLDDSRNTPDWVDYDLMRAGGAMAQRHFPMLVLGLTYGGLPLTFGHPDSAEVFSGTGRMQANISRRLNESASLFLGIYDSDELAPGGTMWEVCLHVRLVHSLIRLNLIKQGWDVAGRGVPVNQLSTAAGPAFFGTHQLGCLRRLGARVSDAESEGFTMIWRYVTRLLGVPEELVGSTQAEQDVFDQHITSLVFAPDDTGRQMMKDLMHGLATQKPTASMPAAMQKALFRRMLGDTMADAYEIPRSPLGELQLRVMMPALYTYGWAQNTPGLSKWLQRTGRRVLKGVATEGIIQFDQAGEETR